MTLKAMGVPSNCGNGAILEIRESVKIPGSNRQGHLLTAKHRLLGEGGVEDLLAMDDLRVMPFARYLSTDPPPAALKLGLIS